MKLNKVTITGIDNSVDYQFIKEMTDGFPFVEWGVLMSSSRKGSPRYPDIGWISGLMDFLIGPDREQKYRNFAAHICGDLCTNFIRDPSVFHHNDLLGGPSMQSIFSRVQLNAYPDRLYSTDEITRAGAALWDTAIFVLPISSNNVEQHALSFDSNFNHFLYDRSRGRGIAPATWQTPLLGGYVGYAGGITRDNIDDLLNDLCYRDGDQNFWIDLETGARDENDRFDTTRVEQTLKLAGEYIG